MSKTIEIVKVAAKGDSIQYELRDNTGLNLLKNETVTAWIRFHNTECFHFSTENIPEPILALPVTLYLLPATWFYGIDLVVPSIDKTLYDNLSAIYAAYSKIYGPFEKEWCGKLIAKSIVENKMSESRFDNIVFFSGGVDAVHAGINNSGKKNVLVSVPSIEGPAFSSKNIAEQNFLIAKSRLIKDFSAVSGSDWLMITNNFRADIFDDGRIQNELKRVFKLRSMAFQADGWFGIKYLANLLSSAPFAYVMGIKNMIMGSSFEQLEDTPAVNLDGSNPNLTDSIKFANVSFGEQDGLHTRRSQKVKDVVEWCDVHNKKAHFWACYHDKKEQCCMCHKCVRTLLNILCTKENPVDWGFANFDENKFSKLIRTYHYFETNKCWIWDIVDSIEDDTVYPYCNKTLHWLKNIGYKKYYKRLCLMRKIERAPWIFKIHKYPHYIKVIFQSKKAQ